MSRIRFATARDLFDTFPTALDDIEVEPTEQPPLDFMRSLMASATPENAVAFCAYMLPRREAVWWACQCVRSLIPAREPAEEAALKAAEAWVGEPEEELRRRALDIGMSGNRGAPTTWLALAAAWSGGSLTPPDQPPAPSPAHLTPKAVRAAVLTALARISVKQRRDRLAACMDEGLKLAGGMSEGRSA